MKRGGWKRVAKREGTMKATTWKPGHQVYLLKGWKAGSGKMPDAFSDYEDLDRAKQAAEAMMKKGGWETIEVIRILQNPKSHTGNYLEREVVELYTN